jgi:N-acetylmuramoyl-L-alanine amidase
LRLLRARTAGLLILGAAFFLPSATAEGTTSFSLALGTRTVELSAPPVVTSNGSNYVLFEALTLVDTYEKMSVATGPMAVQPPEPEPVSEDESEEGAAGGEAISISAKPAAAPASEVPRAFKLAGREYSLDSLGGAIRLLDASGAAVGSACIVQHGRAYLPEDALAALGMRLTYAPETGNLRLIGELRELAFNPKEMTVRFTTLLPATAYAEPLDGEGFRVVVEGAFVKEPTSRALKEAGEAALAARNLSHHRLELRFTQKTETGYKLYAEPKPAVFFRVHFGNHFDLVSYERTSSGEISLNVLFTRPTDVSVTTLVSPNRLVLDFPGAVYDQATKYIDVGIGSVKQIRVGQFSDKPPVVRVVVELKRALRYRVLKQGDGEKYYVQLYSKERRKAVIMLDAGHGGSDTGAIGVTGVYEKSITLQVTLDLARSLRNLGYEVELTRDTDRFVSLGERADLANELLPMVFVSIHANSIEDPAFTGVMTFHFNGAVEASALASSIQQQLLSSTGAVDRKVRTANFFVLRETVVPAVLVEVGFLTNTLEEQKLRDPFYQKRIVDGVARGIDQYLRDIGGF